MAGLTGSDVAYRLAIADEEPRGKTRADTTRSGYFLRDVIPVWINGAARQGMIQESISIDLNTGDEPHRCSFDFKGGSGFVPAAGQSVVIGHGSVDNQLFSGRIIKSSRRAIRINDRRPTYQCEAAGHVFELSMARVGRWFEAASLSASSIINGVIAVSTPSVSSMGFTTRYVQSDLPVVGEFTLGVEETLSSAFGRLFRSIDVTWYVDHDRHIHAFGSIESGYGVVPSTLTANSYSFWDMSYHATDLSRVFSQAMVRGKSTQTLVDVKLGTTHYTVPVDSASHMVSSIFTNSANGGLLDLYTVEDSRWLFDGGLMTESVFYHPKDLLRAGPASVFLPASIGTNTLVAATTNVASVAPLWNGFWYEMAGQWMYVNSTFGVHSATASSISYAFHVTGYGKNDGFLYGAPSLAPISAAWSFYIYDPTYPSSRVVPAGSAVETFAIKSSSITADAVSTLTGSTNYHLITKSFVDRRLSPEGARTVALAALERGKPSEWASLDFVTRDRDVEIGRPVYVSVTSTAESGGSSIAGVFTAQDVQIGGFGRLTNTRGPERAVRAGAVRRPTLWQVLQGD